MTSKKCEHNKRKDRCRECGGSSFCEHDRDKSSCKECGGSSICNHKKRKQLCKECGGSSLCEHNREKSKCKECGGSSFCEHGKRKNICKECGGGSICEHEKQRSKCKECGGGSICEHEKIRSTCKECSGGSICEHGKFKQVCKECGGGSICEHDKIRSVCKECGGGTICKHGKPNTRCKECGGGSFCEHGKMKSRCKECGGSALCKSSWCSTYAINKYEGYCAYCYTQLFPEKPVTRNYKTKERNVAEYVKNEFPSISWNYDKRIVDGYSLYRPDILADLGKKIIIVETDEHKHDTYDCSCELKRMLELYIDVGCRPIIFIRFNPDAYIDKDKNKVASCWQINNMGQCVIKKKDEWNLRLEQLKETIQYWIHNDTDRDREVIQLYYDQD